MEAKTENLVEKAKAVKNKKRAEKFNLGEKEQGYKADEKFAEDEILWPTRDPLIKTTPKLPARIGEFVPTAQRSCRGSSAGSTIWGR